MKKSEPIRIQVSIAAKQPKGARLTPELMRKVIQVWADTGELPVGIKVRAITWRHPKRPAKTVTRKSAIEEVRVDLGRFLRNASVNLRSIRSDERTRQHA